MVSTILLDTPTPHEPDVALRDAALGQPTMSDAAPTEGGSKIREPLLREALGMSLRAYRADKGVSLRELSTQALVSPGYLSELERGRKEVSSEVLASICSALETTVAEVLLEAVANLSLPAITDELEATTHAAAKA